MKPLGLLALGVVVGIGLAVGPRHLPRPAPAPAPKPAPKPDPTPADKPEWFGSGGPIGPRPVPIRSAGFLGGWRTDGGHVPIAAALPRLSQAAPNLMRARAGSATDGRPILLYRAWTDLFKAPPPYEPQQIGDCVSFAHAHALDLLQCIEWVLKHPGRAPLATDIQETDTEFIYATSREVAGILGQGDGSYGAAAVKAMTTVGTVSRRMLGDQGAYSGRRARRWGAIGAPASVKAMAGRFKLGAAAAVTTWSELEAAIAAGHPVTISTQHGFTLERDAQGFARPLRCWPMPDGCGGHCMFVAGIRFDRPGACIVQSWGPDTPSGPTSLGQPPFSFWVDRSAVESILAEGDSFAISAAPRFGAAGRKASSGLPEAWRKAS